MLVLPWLLYFIFAYDRLKFEVMDHPNWGGGGGGGGGREEKEA